jgi:hypothetical protein
MNTKSAEITGEGTEDKLCEVRNKRVLGRGVPPVEGCIM